MHTLTHTGRPHRPNPNPKKWNGTHWRAFTANSKVVPPGSSHPRQETRIEAKARRRAEAVNR